MSSRAAVLLRPERTHSAERGQFFNSARSLLTVRETLHSSGMPESIQLFYFLSKTQKDSHWRKTL
jgi:hypothetical protein